MFDYFLQTNDGLFTKYNIDRNLLKGLSPECKYVQLYRFVAHASNLKEQFSNGYIVNSFKSLTNQYNVDIKTIDIKKEAKTIADILISEEACLSAKE